MPTLADAYSNAFTGKKRTVNAPARLPAIEEQASSLPPPAPASPAAPLSQSNSSGSQIACQALDALSTLQVLKMATADNPMAESFLAKLEHHVRNIVTLSEGSTYWPDKYREHFKDEVIACEETIPSPLTGRSRPSALQHGPMSTGRMPSQGPPDEVDLTETDRLGNFDIMDEEDEEEPPESSRRIFKSSMMLGSTTPKRSKAQPGLQSDADIYNIINAEDKESVIKKRRGLALGQALSHSIKKHLFDETAGSRTTRHPRETFTHIRANDVSFHNVTFSFQEYAPVIFLSIREHFGINNAAFHKSMSVLKGGQVGEGKSGMLFFSTADREFIVKTVTPNELRFLERELKSYYDYMVVNGATSLLPRFVGLYFLKLPDKPTVRLIVMNNVFKLPETRKIEIVETYDLKGSLHTRYVGAEEQALGKVSVLKDLNFCNRHEGTDSHGHPFKPVDGPCRAIYLGPIRKIELLANLQSDVEWLRQHNIMDYSLLLAVGFEVTPDDVTPESVRAQSPEPAAADTAQTDAIMRWQSAWSADLGGIKGMNGDFTERAEIYYMGVIDILQEYNTKKRAEHTLKSFTADSSKISAVDPEFYADRFLQWMESHVA